MKIKLLIKKIKYKIVKFLYNYFKKIYIRNINIDDNEILQYAHNELTIYGYNKDSKYYNDIIEVIAAISKNNNINSSIKHNVSVINKLCDKVPITYLTLKEDEFEQSISSKILYINKRYNKIYKYLNKMFVTNAYSISPQYILSIKTKKLLPFSTDLSWKFDLTYLSLSYDIQWKNCFCMKDIRLEDVTPELEKRAFEEIENNK